MKYTLLIHAPTGEEKQFDSSTPFMPLSQGDVIHMALFQDKEGLNMPLRVISVEHMIWQNQNTGELGQLVSVYTERYSFD